MEGRRRTLELEWLLAAALAHGACSSSAPSVHSGPGDAGFAGRAGSDSSAAGAAGSNAVGRGGAGSRAMGGVTRSGTGGGGSGGMSGRRAEGGAGAGGASSADAGVRAGGPEVIWPNDMSKANSDPWLVQNHDRITQLQPRVLAIDIGNTQNPMPLIQKHIDGLANATSFHKFKDPNAKPAVVYQLVKLVNGGSTPDYTMWNSQAFADSSLQLKDPDDPSGPNLTLCELFEKGVINEVWCMATQNQTKCGETQETKQVYSNTDPPQKQAGKLVGASNGDSVTSLGCKVSIRIIDFNTSRGVGCHQHALGHGWERYMDAGALPFLRKQAARFLNWDLDKRPEVMAPFSNFYSACKDNGSQETDCMVWQSNIHMVSGASAAKSFDLGDLSGGCGNAHFYPNATGTYSYDAKTPDNEVLCSCENYGMHNGQDGKDQTNTFTNKMTDGYATMQPGSTDDDCGGHGTSYLYQNFPGPGTSATNDDGSPMHNFWVYLFY